MNDDKNLLTFGGHLEVLRQMLIRILIAVGLLSVVVFCFKDLVWKLILAPSECNFVTYRLIEEFMHTIGFPNFNLEEYYVKLIATDLSSQFIQHLTTSIYIGVLCASPYILWELFRFITPALYEREKKYSVGVAFSIFVLFALGIFMCYFIIFPIAFRFLGTYSVSEKVTSNITLDSYISTFVTLMLVMGAVFQLPVIAFALAKMGFLRHEVLCEYRKHAFVIIMVIAAVITPPDLMTLILVTIPLYLLYLLSIKIVKIVER